MRSSLRWYSDKKTIGYLRGNTKTNECDQLFVKYRECLNVCFIFCSATLNRYTARKMLTNVVGFRKP